MNISYESFDAGAEGLGLVHVLLEGLGLLHLLRPVAHVGVKGLGILHLLIKGEEPLIINWIVTLIGTLLASWRQRRSATAEKCRHR